MAERKMRGQEFQSRKYKLAETKRQHLVEKYVAEGMSIEKARSKALADLRDNPRKDWRQG